MLPLTDELILVEFIEQIRGRVRMGVMKTNLPVVHELVIEDIRARLGVGIQTYGRPLTPHNGRDALWDAYEEALDLACYLRQSIYERGDSMNKIQVVNQSNNVTDEQARLMAAAVNIQIEQHFAPAWNMLPTAVTCTDGDAWVITLRDHPDQVLPFQKESPAGSVVCQPSIDNGSSVLTGEYAISALLSQECLSLICDPTKSEWVLCGVDHRGAATFVAQEPCDPVEAQYYVIEVEGTECNVSNFVKPEWFDARTKAPYTDILRTLTEPLTISSGGCVVTWGRHGQQETFGESIPQWRIQQKRTVGSRGFKRMITEYPHHHFHHKGE
jgi:hypothetical protein